MKFIFSFLFGILILSPTFASYECTNGTPEDQCTCAGWGHNGFECVQCTNTQYSPASDSVCHDCIDSNGNWTAGAQPVSHSIFDINNTATGQSSCPWKCETGFFKGNNDTECLSCPDASHPKSYGTQDITNIGTCTCPTNTNLIKTTESNGDKYYCGTCGVGTASTTGNITTCTCPATSNQVHGNQAYRTNNGPVECACPDGASWNSQSNKCVCTDTNKTIVLDNETGLYVCSSCSNSNATLDGNVCKCNAGYYGTIDGINTECTQCPIGTTTTIGATQRNECQMNHNTKFCYGSDDNKKCMHLIPAGTVISAPNNT